jgi:hypothetical protein
MSAMTLGTDGGRETVTSRLGSQGEIALVRRLANERDRVLDGIVGPSGEAIGVDAAENFVSAVRREAGEAGITNARFKSALPARLRARRPSRP